MDTVNHGNRWANWRHAWSLGLCMEDWPYANAHLWGFVWEGLDHMAVVYLKRTMLFTLQMVVRSSKGLNKRLLISTAQIRQYLGWQLLVGTAPQFTLRNSIFPQFDLSLIFLCHDLRSGVSHILFIYGGQNMDTFATLCNIFRSFFVTLLVTRSFKLWIHLTF